MAESLQVAGPITVGERVRELFSLRSLPSWILFSLEALKALIKGFNYASLGDFVWSLKENPHVKTISTFLGGPWGTLVILAAGFLWLAYLVVRPERKTKNADRPTSLPVSGQTDIERALIQSNAQAANVQQKLSVLQARDDEFKWLHDLAIEQAKAIQDWVYIDFCKLGSYDLLRRSEPYIQFQFFIRNTSVYRVSLGALSGEVDFGGPLSGKLEWVRGFNDEIYPGAGRPHLENDCVIRLTLNDRKQVAGILNQGGWFGFDHMRIAISGSQDSVKPHQQLLIKCGVENTEFFNDGRYKRLAIEILEYQLWTYWKWGADGYPDERLGSIVNLKVRFRNSRDEVIQVDSFKLDTSGPSGTHRTLATLGELFEEPGTGLNRESGYKGKSLEPNLNVCPVHAEPGTPHEGWLQFIVLGQMRPELVGTTPTLIMTDSWEVEHSRGCVALQESQR